MDGRIKISDDTLKMQEYIENQKDGEELSYLKITHDTGIEMNTRGKQILRRGIKRAKREYSTIRTYGIKLACPESALPILSTRIIRIDRAVRRAEKTHHIIESQFLNQLSHDEQKQVLFAGAVFGAIRIAAENGKRLYQRKIPVNNDEIKISIPFVSV